MLALDLKSITTSVQTPSFITMISPGFDDVIAELSSTAFETRISLPTVFEENPKQIKKSPMQGIKINLFFIFTGINRGFKFDNYIKKRSICT